MPGTGGRDAGSPSDGSVVMPGGLVNNLTHKYNNARTGWNAAEKILTLANVNEASFGKLFTRPVEGQIYAQPLVVAGLQIGGKVRNVVYVVTMKNNAYAFDADDAQASAPLWMVKLGPSASSQLLCEAGDIHPDVGATATPVIDLDSKTIFFTTKHFENGKHVQRLQALDIVTGMPRSGSPVIITATVPSTDPVDSVDGKLTFNPQTHLNRPGLLLQAGTVYFAFASHCDIRPYHGWVLAYDAATLKQKFAYVTTPAGQGGGIWASGNGLVGDGTNIYFSTGNGETNPDPTNPQLCEALVKLDNSLKLVDWHIRGNYKDLDGVDADFGMSGPLLMSKQNLLISAGKDAWALVYDKNNLGKYKADDTNVVQKFKGAGVNTFNFYHSGGFVMWEDSPMGAPLIYGWPAGSRLLGFKFNGTKLDETPVVIGSVNAPAVWGWGLMVGTSNGAENGIIWLNSPLNPSDEPNQMIVPGKLRALDAIKGTVLFDSAKMPANGTGMFATYSFPTVANGKVYMPSWGEVKNDTTSLGALHVFGLK